MIIVTKMYEMLEQEHFNFTSLKERSFDYAAWEKKVNDCYQDAAPGIIALEEKHRKIIFPKEINVLLSLRKMVRNRADNTRKPSFFRRNGIFTFLPWSTDETCTNWHISSACRRCDFTCKRSKKPLYFITDSVGYRIIRKLCKNNSKSTLIFTDQLNPT